MRLSDWPSLRLVLPLAGGIAFSNTIQDTGTLVHISCVLLIPAVAVVLTAFLLGKRLPHLYGAGLFVCLFFSGCLLYGCYSMKVHIKWSDMSSVHNGHLIDWPQEKARSYRLDVELDDSVAAGRRIILYVPKDSAAVYAVPGMTVGFYGAIREPANSADAGFDYAGYLYRQGISGTLWVPSDRWTVVTAPDNISLKTKTMLLRHRMVEKLREWGLEGRSLAVAAAVSLGEKRALDDSLKQLYSNTGASHVLAVSGLHIGIICWLLGVLVPGILFPYRIRWLRELIVISVLWMYAFAIGLPLSITRALVMFSMFALCRSLGGDSSPGNALALSALVILTVQPQGLFDIGFQLSYSAVAAILMFEPGIRRLVEPKTVLGRYFWGIAAVSLAAQLGTAPLIACHFGAFSTWFLLANIAVVPLMFATVCLSVFVWALGWYGPARAVTVWLLDSVISLENGILEKISLLPHSTIEFNVDNEAMIWAAYALILSVYMWLHEKNTHRLVQGLSAVASILLFNLVFGILT